MRENVGRARAAGGHAPENRADAQHELLRAERLREIVVRAERRDRECGPALRGAP